MCVCFSAKFVIFFRLFTCENLSILWEKFSLIQTPFTTSELYEWDRWYENRKKAFRKYPESINVKRIQSILCPFYRQISPVNFCVQNEKTKTINNNNNDKMKRMQWAKERNLQGTNQDFVLIFFFWLWEAIWCSYTVPLCISVRHSKFILFFQNKFYSSIYKHQYQTVYFLGCLFYYG